MPRSFHFPPLAGLAQSLLSDLICTPVAMRTERFVAIVGELHAIASGKDTERLRQVAEIIRAQADTEDDCYPWEEPIYEVVDGGIAIVNVCGPLVKGYDDFTCWYFGCMSTDRLQSSLLEIQADANIRAVIVNLNSPGGVSTGMPEVADAIVALDQQKACFAFTSDMACSNGYRIAAACRAILCTRSAVLGSIGTYIALYDYSEYLKELGISLQMFRDGKLKGIGVMGKEITADEQKFLQDCVNESGAIFKDFVRSRRPDVTDDTMQGQWFSGQQAVKNGLADVIVLSLSDVVADLRKYAA